MFGSLIQRFSGAHHRKFLKGAKKTAARICQIEEGLLNLSDTELQSKTEHLRKAYEQAFKVALEKLGKKADFEKTAAARQAVLDELLPEAFAVVKAAARRLCGRPITYMGIEETWNMVPYNVQLMGGIALHRNYIAEMATGEGKTLVACLPLYLNALSRCNCQLVTVNEYLAQRDAEWMGHLYNFLGLKVGVVKSFQSSKEKAAAYQADITYGTASELGFDYLRDNGMAMEKNRQFQKEHYFCIVDEIDSILIDEARTPLIISGEAEHDHHLPLERYRNKIKQLTAQQSDLCSRLAKESTQILEKKPLSKEEKREALSKLLQVKMGSPRNRQLLRLMEEGETRQALDRFEIEMQVDMNKEALYHLKEELFYNLDERHHQADLTEHGRETLNPADSGLFMLPDLSSEIVAIEEDPKIDQATKNKAKAALETNYIERSTTIHAVSQLLRAYALYERDRAYVVHEGQAIIVDENTGRMMQGRRWSDGLHQAIESKEGLKIQPETKTYATITIQNYFRLYEKLAGMTGTAETEAQEFFDIYALKVTVIPPNRPCVRVDEHDAVYKTRREKYAAALSLIEQVHKAGQPVLVGTASVEDSELVSRMLTSRKIRHAILNAKQHEKEAQIISEAGHKAAVTIATNMAGRGTDIKLEAGIEELGGLFVLGTQRHESRRVDRQLRGRCARQGDPGHSKFFISLEDDLMRIFAQSGPLARLLKGSFQEGDALEHPLLNRSIEGAQKRVEQHNYSMRKRLLQYDDVLNRQREVIYNTRNEALWSHTPEKLLFETVQEAISNQFLKFDDNEKTLPDPDALNSVLNWFTQTFSLKIDHVSLEGLNIQACQEKLSATVEQAYMEKRNLEEEENSLRLERYLIVYCIDKLWQDHLTEMEDLRQAVSFHAYGQKDPLIEYKNQAFSVFQTMMNAIGQEICSSLFRIAASPQAFELISSRFASKKTQLSGPETASLAPDASSAPVSIPVRSEPKIGRNELVTVGKGPEKKTLKYKKAKILLEQGWTLTE